MESIEEILKQWHPLVNNLSGRYYKSLDIPFEDMVQELNITVWRAYSVYDPSKYKTKFSTCLITYLKQRIQNLKNERHVKKRSGFSVYSLEYFCISEIEELFERLDFSLSFRTSNERFRCAC